MTLIQSLATAAEHWESPYAVSDYALRNPSRSNLLCRDDISFESFDPVAADLCAPATLETAVDAQGETSLYAPPATLRRNSAKATTPPDLDAARRYFAKRHELHAPPYHLLVLKDNTNKHRANDIRIHVCTTSLPKGSFYKLADDTYVVSPELCFAQMATVLDRIRLIDFGFRLCGQYAMATHRNDGFVFRRPVSDVSFLTKQLGRMGGVRGAKQALSAAAHVCDGSASPRKTHLAMLLSLPCAWGGYGLPRPLLNHRVEMPATHTFQKSHYFCDLYWPDGRLAVEYDSDACHTGATRIARDAQRRSALALRGIDVVTVTNEQIKSLAETDRIALLIAQRLGTRLRFDKRYDYHERRIRLRAQLLGGERTPFSASVVN